MRQDFDRAEQNVEARAIAASASDDTARLQGALFALTGAAILVVMVLAAL